MTPLAIAKGILIYGPEVLDLYQRLAEDLAKRPDKPYTADEIVELVRLRNNTGRSVLDTAGLKKAVAALEEKS